MLSLVVAPSQDVATADWFSLDSLGDGLRDYATVFAGVAGWAVFGTTLAVIFRSAPLALGVGFAWAGPFENIVVDSWTDRVPVLPRPGARRRSSRAARPSSASAGPWSPPPSTPAIAAAVALVLVSRRDVTT